MKNVIEILEKQYQSFINQERDWNFFVGLADYVKFINETSEPHLLLERTKESKLKRIEIIDKLEEEAVTELLKLKRDLLKIIKNEKIAKEGLSEALSKLDDYEKGKISPNHYKSSRLDEGLRNLIKALSDSEEDFAKNYPRYGLSKKLLIRMAKSSELHEKKETELWGAYEKLQLVFRVIYSGKEYLSFLEEHKRDIDEYVGLLDEMETIKNDGENRFFSLHPHKRETYFSLNEFRKKNFKRDNYKLYATRIHNYLIQKLNTEEIGDPTNGKTDFKASFDKDKGVLKINDKQIKVKKFSNQYHLLKIIFENQFELSKEWFFSEIAEIYDTETPPPDKKFYNATYQINQKVAIETGTKGFFITTNQSLKINPKYI